MRAKLNELLKIVEEEYKKVEKSYQMAKESAQEIAKTALTSHSQAGDRFHSQGAMDIAEERLKNVEKLLFELKSSEINKIVSFTEVPCYIKTDKTDFFLVKNTILISGVRLVSANSVIGKDIINKQVGNIVNGIEILEIE